MGKILITGGAGYIGSHTVKQLGLEGFEQDLLILDNLSTGHKEAVLYGELLVGNIEDQEFTRNIFKNYEIDSIIHFAGSIVVPESVSDPLKYYFNNTANALFLLSLCKEFKVKNFIFSSTAAVYGNLSEQAATEDLPPAPESPYGMSKLMTEQMLKDYANSNPNFNFVILRYFNVAGADPDYQIGQSFPDATHLIKVSAQVACGIKESLTIFGNDYDTEDGTCIRDYIHVADLAMAHVEALKYLKNGGDSQIFNCGYGIGLSVQEIVDKTIEVSKTNFPYKIGERRAGDPARIVANCDKIKERLNWVPKYNDISFIIETAFNWEKNKKF